MTAPTRTVRNMPRLRATLKRDRKVAEDEGLYFAIMTMMTTMTTMMMNMMTTMMMNMIMPMMMRIVLMMMQ